MILARKTTKLSCGYKLLEIIQTNRIKGSTIYFYSIEITAKNYLEAPIDVKISQEKAEEIIKKWRAK
ncbi:MAG: hypothetical protein K6C94_02135 [Candidatus Gastranaerophilales bacterium]|nr:hypothetical protein [Candidatus Gastranaerophilales bacterium]